MNNGLKVYSDYVKAGLILPKKQKYTKRDCDAVLVNSLFKAGQTLTPLQARAVVRCSAHFHETDYSEGVTNYAK